MIQAIGGLLISSLLLIIRTLEVSENVNFIFKNRQGMVFILTIFIINIFLLIVTLFIYEQKENNKKLFIYFSDIVFLLNFGSVIVNVNEKVLLN